MEETGDEERRVGDCQHLQQKRGRTFHRLVATEDDDAEQVAEDADNNERERYRGVDDPLGTPECNTS